MSESHEFMADFDISVISDQERGVLIIETEEYDIEMNTYEARVFLSAVYDACLRIGAIRNPNTQNLH